jgi:hypothetical protein
VTDKTSAHEVKRKHCGESSGTGGRKIPRCASREETAGIIGALRKAVAGQSKDADKSSSLIMVAQWLNCAETRHEESG